MISEEAVEKAARVYDPDAWAMLDSPEPWVFGYSKEYARNDALTKMRAALTANSVSPEAAELERLMRGYQLECNECEQIAGKALGYPWYKDDQKNCPGATEADGVCVGEHVPSSVVAELARRYTELSTNSVNPDAASILAAVAEVETLRNWIRNNCKSPSPPEPDALAAGSLKANWLIERARAEKAESECRHLEHLLACVADHATGGILSKTNYEKETYYELIDAHIEKLCQEAIAEHGAEPDALAVIEAARAVDAAYAAGDDMFDTTDALSRVLVAYDKAKRHTPAASSVLTEARRALIWIYEHGMQKDRPAFVSAAIKEWDELKNGDAPHPTYTTLWNFIDRLIARLRKGAGA